MIKNLKCLKIKPKWLNLILSDDPHLRKTLELRRTRTKYVGPIALGNTETKKVEGYAHLECCVEFFIEELKRLDGLHRANEFISDYANERETLFAYSLKNTIREPNPYPYSFSTGSWCFSHKDSTHYHSLLLRKL